MTRSIRTTPCAFLLSILPYLLTSLLPPAASAQVQRGTPPFGSFGGGPDIINISNLNSHLCIPILHKPGRGTSFMYDLCYDSSVWYPVTSGGTTTWQPDALWGWNGSIPRAAGYATYNTGPLKSCQFFQETRWVTEYYHILSNWVYHDGFGTPHAMIGQIQDGAGDCGPATDAILTTNDGSGYKLSVPDETLYTVFGAVGVLTSVQTFTDRNGNKINVDASGNFFDTLSSTTPTLTVASTGSPTTQTTYTYTAPSGADLHPLFHPIELCLHQPKHWRVRHERNHDRQPRYRSPASGLERQHESKFQIQFLL